MFIFCWVRVNSWVSDLETDQYIQNPNGEKPEPSHWWDLHGLDLFQQVPWMLDQTGIWGIWRQGRPSWNLALVRHSMNARPLGVSCGVWHLGLWRWILWLQWVFEVDISLIISFFRHVPWMLAQIEIWGNSEDSSLTDLEVFGITDCHCHEGVYLVCSGVYMGCVCQMTFILMQGPRDSQHTIAVLFSK